MRFETDVRDTDFLALLARCVRITGQAAWDKKFEWIRRQRIDNPFLHEWLHERHGIEITLWQLLIQQQETGQFPLDITDQQQYRLCGFVAAVANAYPRLSPLGQNRLRGMILSGLQDDNGLMSLQHEMTTAVHLMSRGFDVEFNDMDNGSGVDYIARKEGIEIEVECKMFTGDIGRQIHKRRVLSLHKVLAPIVEQVYKAARRGIFIRVTVPGRLTPSNAQLQGIASTVSRGVLAGTATTRTDYCDVSIHDFDIASSPFSASRMDDISRKDVAAFIHRNFGNDNPNLVIFVSPGRSATVAMIESSVADKVLKGIERQLRDSTKGQFTGTRPGILAVQLYDLTPQQLFNLGRADGSTHQSATGLQLMTTHLLNSQNRNSIHTVVYTSHGVVKSEGGIVSASGPAYFVRNPNNPLYDDQRYWIFGTSDGARKNPQ
jgi:hypothetical protein